MKLEHILYDVKDRIARLTLNRPDKLNALSHALLGEVGRAIEEAAADEAVGAVLLTGAGKAFAAGADIAEFVTQTPEQAVLFAQRGQALLNRIETLGKPVVAAVNGFALGGGCELAMACSFRTASSKAKFGQPEVKLGIIPGYGGTQRLSRLVGLGRAMELVAGADMIDAGEAHRIGLVNHVFAPEALIGETEAILGRILANGPLAVRHALLATFHGAQTSLAQGLEIEAAHFGVSFASDDRVEGVTAFLEKRAPTFRGR